MYYVVSTTYVGPNQNEDQYLNVDRVDIQTVPERGNSRVGDKFPEIIDGWCGTTNDWSVHAHGEHATIESARAKVAEITNGEYRDNPDTDLHQDEPSIVESYLVGAHEQIDADGTCQWCWAQRDEVTADTTDEQIERMVDECAAELLKETGCEADTEALKKMLTEARDEAIADRDDD